MKKYFLQPTGILLLIITCVSFTIIPPKMKSKKKIWINLFDGSSLKGWHGFNKTGTIQNWTIEDGLPWCCRRCTWR
jgi:hypothetical protein